MPERPCLAHFAPEGQPESKPQASAQYFLPEAESDSMHCGVAFVPAGLSVGQAPLASHSGAHTSPSMPWIEASTSSERHGGFS